MSYLSITSDRETIKGIEEFFKSDVLSAHRTMKLSGTRHEEGYSNACIVPKEEGKRIAAEDIFWMGLHVGTAMKREAPNEAN